MASSNSFLRQLIGIETETGFEKKEITRQRIYDNLILLDEKTYKSINNVIVKFGHKVFNHKENDFLSAKTDSFVVESNVHFPSDYNLLSDSLRKALDTINWFVENSSETKGWRKLNDWHQSIKNLSRNVGKASSSGGKNKILRVKEAVTEYINKATALRKKISDSKNDFPQKTLKDIIHILELERFIELTDKHIDLLERRVLKGEKIPHSEKLFSIFEEYTEWITKGKKRPSVELGKKVSITTDQYNLIIDHYVMENESDSQVVLSTADRVLSLYFIYIVGVLIKDIGTRITNGYCKRKYKM